MRLYLGYKIVVQNFFVSQTQAEQSQFPTTMPTTKPTHLLLLLLPRPAAAATNAAAASSPGCCCCYLARLRLIGKRKIEQLVIVLSDHAIRNSSAAIWNRESKN